MSFGFYFYFYISLPSAVLHYCITANLLICNYRQTVLKKIELNIVGLSYSQAQSNSYALVLGEVHGKRRLPIVIGHYEAQAIALELEKMKPSRPLTHDLFYNFAKIFGIRVTEVQITKFHEGIFYATLTCDNGVIAHEIDSRTSDAVALSIRFHCPIFTTEEIMAQAGILYEEEDSTGDNTDDTEGNDLPSIFRNLSLSELEVELQQAIEDEDYERASLIRDEIRKRE
jgi:uncharacterized protein